MYEREIYKVMEEISSLNGNEPIPTLTIYNMSLQLFKDISPLEVSKEFHNALNQLEKKGEIYCPRRNYYKPTKRVGQVNKEENDYNQTYEKEEMLGDKSIDQKLEELYNSIDEQPLDLLKGIMNIREKINVEELEDRVSKLENALLELAHYPCKNEFNRDDIYLALRKAGMVRGFQR